MVTRYIEEYNYPPGLPSSEKTVENARAYGWIKQISYEVSDEEFEAEVEAEAREEAIAEITQGEIASVRARLLAENGA